jgi:cytochrome b561
MKTVDLGQLIDEGSWSGFQILLIFGTALTIILDGIDNQLLPNAITLMMKEWSVAAFAVTLTIICLPLGGFVAAYLSKKILPVYGWHRLPWFVVITSGTEAVVTP